MAGAAYRAARRNGRVARSGVAQERARRDVRVPLERPRRGEAPPGPACSPPDEARALRGRRVRGPHDVRYPPVDGSDARYPPEDVDGSGATQYPPVDVEGSGCGGSRRPWTPSGSVALRRWRRGGVPRQSRRFEVLGLDVRRGGGRWNRGSLGALGALGGGDDARGARRRREGGDDLRRSATSVRRLRLRDGGAPSRRRSPPPAARAPPLCRAGMCSKRSTFAVRINMTRPFVSVRAKSICAPGFGSGVIPPGSRISSVAYVLRADASLGLRRDLRGAVILPVRHRRGAGREDRAADSLPVEEERARLGERGVGDFHQLSFVAWRSRGRGLKMGGEPRARSTPRLPRAWINQASGLG